MPLQRLTVLFVLLPTLVASVALAAHPLVRDIETAEENGEEERLRQLVEQAQADAPDDPSVIYWSGRLSMMDEDFDAAMKQFDRARELEPTNGTYHRWSGHAHIEKLQTVNFFSKRGLAKKAIERFQKAVEVAPNDASARESLAQYYLQAPGIVGGSKDKGLEQIEALRKIDPARAASSLGWYYNEKKKHDLALAQFEQGMADAPDSVRMVYNHALYMQTRKNWNEAFSGFEKVRTMTEGATQRRERNWNAAGHYQLFRTVAFSGERVDEGIAWVHEYLERDLRPGQPEPTNAYWRLGMIYEHKGDKAQARTAYEKSLELDPENENAKKALKKLK